MNITKTNYESWFLDYYEGNLSAIQVAELFLFLQQNNELQNEFESFNPINIASTEYVYFDAKESLKRQVITVHNIDYYLIGELEDNLNLKEKTQLHAFLKLHPELEDTRELYRKTKLQAVNEVYGEKKALKRKLILPIYKQWSYWAAAAIVIFLLGIIYINRPEDVKRVAQQENNNTRFSTGINNTNKQQNIVDEETSNNNLAVVPNISAEKENNNKLPDQKKNDLLNTRSLKNNFLAQENNINENKNSALSKNKKNVLNITTSRPFSEEPMLMAEKNTAFNIGSRDFEMTPLKRINMEVAGSLASSTASRKRFNIEEKFNDWKDVAANKVNETTGEEILYSQKQVENGSNDRIPLKSRIFKLLAWSINSIGGENVQMKTDFDQSGNLARYDISAGKFKYERDF